MTGSFVWTSVLSASAVGFHWRGVTDKRLYVIISRTVDHQSCICSVEINTVSIEQTYMKVTNIRGVTGTDAGCTKTLSC